MRHRLLAITNIVIFAGLVIVASTTIAVAANPNVVELANLLLQVRVTNTAANPVPVSGAVALSGPVAVAPAPTVPFRKTLFLEQEFQNETGQTIVLEYGSFTCAPLSGLPPDVTINVSLVVSPANGFTHQYNFAVQPEPTAFQGNHPMRVYVLDGETVTFNAGLTDYICQAELSGTQVP